MKAMILAAGLGTRLRPYTEVLAKPAIPFLNIPLFYYSIALLQSAQKFKLTEIVVNSHHKPEQVCALAKALSVASQDSLKVEVSFEKAAPLGSGGGVWWAREHFKNEKDFFVTNGDEVILPRHLQLMDKMLEQHQASNALATILVKCDARVGTQFGGVWANPMREVFGFGKQSPNRLSSPACLAESVEGFHYMGVMILNSRALQYFPEGESNILYDGMMNAISANEKVEVYIDDCRWYETGNIKDYLLATSEVLKDFESHPQDLFLNALVKKFAPEARLHSGILTGKNVEIHPQAQLSGFVVLGDQVKVPAGCILQNVVVQRALTLEARSYQNDLILAP